jgi:hypothetical protein
VTGAELGSVLAAAGLVPLLCLPDLRLRAAGFIAFTAGICVLAADLLHSPIARVRVQVTDRPALAAGAAIVGLATLAGAAWLLRRRPWLLLIAAVATAPARIPVHAAGEDAHLLLPLYAVLAVGWLVLGWSLLRGDAAAPQLGWAGRFASAFLLWSAISLSWSADSHQGGIELLFFLLPFGLLAALVAAGPLGRWELRLALIVQVVLGVGFALVGFYQYAAKDVFWNPKIIVGNEYASFFRVNSLFWDASIYGRFMAVTIVLVAGVAVYRRLTPQLGVLIVVLFAGLYISYSQSSLLALAAGSLVLATTVWPRRVTIAVIAAGLAIGLGGLAVSLAGNSARNVSSDRSHLLDLGRHVIAEHPLAGAGVGGFARAAVADTKTPWKTTAAESHTTPMTVLAELGPLGLLAYLGLLGALALDGIRLPRSAVRMTLLAVGAALLVSSLFYNAFFEDPTTWIVLGLLAALAARSSTISGAVVTAPAPQTTEAER